MQNLSGTLLRLHSPLNLRVVDLWLLRSGCAFGAVGLVLLAVEDWSAAGVALLGGAIIAAESVLTRRRRMAAVWTMATDTPDPVRSLVLFEYLYGLRFGDLRIVSAWREQREMAGLPMEPTDDDPPEVRAVWEHLARIPLEGDNTR